MVWRINPIINQLFNFFKPTFLQVWIPNKNEDKKQKLYHREISEVYKYNLKFHISHFKLKILVENRIIFHRIKIKHKNYTILKQNSKYYLKIW